jgi:hypothetical protein
MHFMHFCVLNNSSEIITELKKDPGIPNLWPFKEQLLDQIEANKQKLKDEHDRRRQLSKQDQLAEMVAAAEGKEDAYGNREDESDEEGYVGSFLALLAIRFHGSFRSAMFPTPR